jgi:hypothetical protein
LHSNALGEDITKAAAVRQAAEQSRGGSARKLYGFASSHVKTSKSLTSSRDVIRDAKGAKEVSYMRYPAITPTDAQFF